VQCPETGWYGSGEACTPCPKVRYARIRPFVLMKPWKGPSTELREPRERHNAPATMRQPHCHHNEPATLSQPHAFNWAPWQGAVCPGGFRMWPEEGYWNHGEVRPRLSVRTPEAMIEPSPLSTVRMHGSAICLAVPPQLMVRVCAQDAKSVRPCSPPALERCLGGRITDLYSGCGIAYAGTAPPFSIDFGVSFPRPPCASRRGGHCMSRAGPYCGACATGYFKKGKICAECDGNTRNIMYVSTVFCFFF
jgi:hypothetical protein